MPDAKTTPQTTPIPAADHGDEDAATLIQLGLKARGKPADTSAATEPLIALTAPVGDDGDDGEAAAETPRPAAPGKPAASDKPGGEVAALKQRIADMEAREKGRTTRLDGEYAKATYIAGEHAESGLPVALLARWLPATTDKAALAKSRDDLGNLIKQVLQSEVSRGRMFFRNIGPASADGGTVPSRVTSGSFTGVTADQLIADGLRDRRRQQ